MLYVAVWYVSIRPVVMRVKEEVQFFLHPHNRTSITIQVENFCWDVRGKRVFEF
jgi:hypothetical protein